ncbi:MAG: HK97 family phage prohead protease [bacterium]
MEMERRDFPISELRISGDDKAPKITGHAAIFDTLSLDLGGFKEKIAPGAFKKTIRNGDVRALFNHNPDYVLGRTKSGTLKLKEDQTGLAISIDPPDTGFARDLQESIARGDIDQMSFGFRCIKDAWENQEGKNSVRTLLEVELFDVSPVTFPAYPQTDVNVRSAFTAVGLSYENLAGILIRAQRGLALTGSDHDTIRAAITVLQSHLPTEPKQPDAQGAHDDGHVARLAQLRRRLELAVA